MSSRRPSTPPVAPNTIANIRDWSGVGKVTVTSCTVTPVEPNAAFIALTALGFDRMVSSSAGDKAASKSRN